jgi:hypothetical protein
MKMRPSGLVVLATLALLPAGADADAGPVAVVPLEVGPSYRMAARLSIAVRRALVSNGWVVKSPAVVLSPPGTPAPETVKEAHAKLVEGATSYDGLEFKKARAALAEAAELYREAIQTGGPKRDYVRCLHYLAASALYDDRRMLALAYFAEAHALAPKQRPDEAVFSPDVFKVYEAAIKSESGRGTLRIESVPPGEVLVNGREVGASPLTVKRPAGHHLVTLRRAGYETELQWAVVNAEGSVEVRARLAPLSQKTAYYRTLAAVRRELATPAPGAATARLSGMLSVRSVVLVTYEKGAARAVWAQKGAWSRSYRATVRPGGERAFAAGFGRVGSVAGPAAGTGCVQPSDCLAGLRCVRGRCVSPVSPDGTPFYKTWWFWTVVGVTVAGGATGVIVWSTTRSERWKAELRPGGML